MFAILYLTNLDINVSPSTFQAQIKIEIWIRIGKFLLPQGFRVPSSEFATISKFKIQNSKFDPDPWDHDRIAERPYDHRFAHITMFNKMPAIVAESLSKMKGTLLETLAKRMPTKDAEMLARHWGYVSETGTDAPPAAPAATAASLPTKSSPSPAPSPQSSVFTIPADVKDDCLFHPTFGERLVDLGYKRIYLTNISSLARAPIWEKQRILRPDRAARIAQSKVHSGRASSFIGAITMFEDKKSGRIGIVDGQHRAAAYLLLSQQGHVDSMDRKVVVDVFGTESDEEVSLLFKEINSAEPIRLIDMPGEGASEKVKELLDATTDKLSAEFEEMFKPSLKCKPPHLNVDVFRDDVFQSEIISRKNFKTAKELQLRSGGAEFFGSGADQRETGEASQKNTRV